MRMHHPRRSTAALLSVALAPLGLAATGSAANAANAASAAPSLAAPSVSPPRGFVPVTPGRLLDTRQTAYGARPLADNEIRKVQVTGRASVPTTGVGAVAVNITVVDGKDAGYLTAWPGGAAKPGTSSVNYRRGQTVASSVMIGVGPDGTMNLAQRGLGAHVVVDVTGWCPKGSGVTPLNPTRALDTRSSGPTLSATPRTLRVAGVGGVPANAIAVTATVTVTQPAAAGFLTVWPAGRARPVASNVNFTAGQSVANHTFATVGTGGAINLATSGPRTHGVVDITGYLTPDSGYVPLTPVRVVDTRSGSYWDGGYGSTTPVTPTPRAFDATAPREGSTERMPWGPGSVVANVTAIGSSPAGYLTAWPDEGPRPGTSTVNYPANATVANGTVLGTPDALFSMATAPGGNKHTAVDVSGYFPADGVGLVNLVSRFRDYSLGADPYAVVFCTKPGSKNANHTTIMNTLNSHVKPFYTWLSNGRYAPSFTDVAPGQWVSATTPAGCEIPATRKVPAGRYQSMLVIWADDSRPPEGESGPGAPFGTNGTFPANSRSGWVTASTMVAIPSAPAMPGVVEHEMGHMLDFPHSYVDGATSPYSNPADYMSGGLPGGQPVGTLAINRLRAGWLDPQQVVVHRGTSATYTIRPIGVAGTQLVAIPSGTDGKFTTLDARAKSSYDARLAKTGLAVHLYDASQGGLGLDERIAPAVGPQDSFNHVLGANQLMNLGDVTIRTGAIAADGSVTVTVSGSVHRFSTKAGYRAGKTANPTPSGPRMREGTPKRLAWTSGLSASVFGG